MTINIHPAISAGLQQFRIREPLTGAEWADRYFYLSPESSGIEGKWTTYPYQRALINWMTDDDIEEINLQKSARVGYTKCLLVSVGYGIEQKRRNIAIWQPTDGDAQGFVSDEVDPMLRDVPLLGALLKCPVGSKSKFNTIEKKQFHGATLDIKGGKSGRNYRRMTKDVAIYDECDGFDPDIDKEGSPFKLGDMRINTSSFPKSIRGSTPKVKGVSLIEGAVDGCRHVFYRYLPCPQCGTLQRLEFSNLRTHGEESGQFTCINGCAIDYASYPEMDAAGRWQTIEGIYYDDDTDLFFSPEDEIIDRPRKIAARIWAAYSYSRTWAWIAEEWNDAVALAKRGDTTSLKTVINTILGETWEEKGESVEPTGLSERTEAYTPDCIPAGVILITFGADVQGGKNPRIELEIVGHGLEGETWSLDYVVINGDPEQQAVWDHLEEQTQRRFTREDGVTLGIAGGFVDSGYLASQVYRFTGPRRGRNIYATKGVLTGTICNAGTWQGDKKSGRAILHTANVDELKELIFGRLKKITEPGPGYCHFPDSYGPEFFDMLTNEQKKEKKKAGRLIGYEWSKKQSHIGNEPLDCRAYALAALARLNPNMPRIKARMEKRASLLSWVVVEKKESTPMEKKVETRKQQKRPRRRKGFVNNW
jgi:phage terminase large subunit GpA-like protein